MRGGEGKGMIPVGTKGLARAGSEVAVAGGFLTIDGGVGVGQTRQLRQRIAHLTIQPILTVDQRCGQ
jgi:hypothetical protein